MATDFALRPGSVSGPYPERPLSGDSPLEQALQNWLRHWRAPVQSKPRKRRTFLGDIREHARRIEKLTTEELRAERDAVRSQLIEGDFEPHGVARCFALIREVAGRELGMRHHAVQLRGGWAVLSGFLAEMQTGEGKTLTATLPASAAALAGIPVHVISVNDYLVERDAEEMRPVYEALGLTVGTVVAGMSSEARQAAYRCDVCYCNNKEVVFDYLKDRMLLGQEYHGLNLRLSRLQGARDPRRRLLLRGLCFGIVDEADSVLIDEGRTPFILSQPGKAQDELKTYRLALWFAEQLQDGRDYALIPSRRSVTLTPRGQDRVAELAAPQGGVWHGARRREFLITQALSALHLFVRNRDYMVREGKIEIIDENTGRAMPDRTWSDGLHQLIEAKECCDLSVPNQTLARISYQRFFRRYLRLGGMTGTAQEVQKELNDIYGLRVVAIPTHKPSRRNVYPDRVFATQAQKWQAIVERVKTLHANGQPCLLGTRTVADSEHLSGLLREAGLPHQLLNARHDAEEAQLVSKAGAVGAITVATNMAGRGTDIKLGPGVADRGGLAVIICERNFSGRVDRQLAGRGARQGDPGSAEAIYSLEDEVPRLYGGGRLLRGFWPFLPPRLRAGLGARLVRRAQQRLEKRDRKLRKILLAADEKEARLLSLAGISE